MKQIINKSFSGSRGGFSKKPLAAGGIFIIMIIIGFSLNASEKVSVSGYYKLFFTGFKMPEVGEVEEPPIGSTMNAATLSGP